MKFTMTKIAAAAALAMASTGAMAAADPVVAPSAFVMYMPGGAHMNTDATIGGFVDTVAGTWGVSSTMVFSGLLWTASGGALYDPGTYTISTADATCGGLPSCASGPDVTFTVGAGQLGGSIKFAWGSTGGIDVVNVWDVSTDGIFNTYTSTDVDGDGTLGLGMVDGPFPGFSANFNMTTPVPEASTYGMMLAGLGLVGFAVRRRKLMA